MLCLWEITLLWIRTYCTNSKGLLLCAALTYNTRVGTIKDRLLIICERHDVNKSTVLYMFPTLETVRTCWGSSTCWTQSHEAT